MCKNCTCVVDLIDILTGSNTDDEGDDTGHYHRLFDSVDKGELERLRDRIVSESK